MTKPELTEAQLDAMFSSARRDVADPTPDFLSGLEAAAVHALKPQVRPPEPRLGWFAQLSEALGGWTGLSGLATAAVAGVWIGVSPPDLIPDPLGVVSGFTDETVSIDGWLTTDADTWQDFDDG